MGTGMTQNLSVFHHISSSSVSFLPLPSPICDAFRQTDLMETPKGKNKNIPAHEGLQRVLQAKNWAHQSVHLLVSIKSNVDAFA